MPAPEKKQNTTWLLISPMEPGDEAGFFIGPLPKPGDVVEMVCVNPVERGHSPHDLAFQLRVRDPA